MFSSSIRSSALATHRPAMSASALPVHAGDSIEQHVVVVASSPNTPPELSMLSDYAVLPASLQDMSLEVLKKNVLARIVELPELHQFALKLPVMYRGEVGRFFRFANPAMKTKQWLRHVIRGGDIGLMRFCFDSGVDNALINAIDAEGLTALMWACCTNNRKIVKLLLKQDGLDPNHRNEFGSTALLEAARYGHLEVITELLGNPDIDVGVVNSHGETALSVTSREFRQQLEMLLQERARSQSR